MLGSNFALLVKSPGDDGQQLLTTGCMWGKRLAAMILAICTSNGVTSEVNLRECISYMLSLSE